MHTNIKRSEIFFMATHRAHSVLKEENITYHESRAEDRDGISSLNSSFRTSTVLCVNIASDGLGFTVKETTNYSLPVLRRRFLLERTAI